MESYTYYPETRPQVSTEYSMLCINRMVGSKECVVKPPLGVNMGTLMAETFKKMETAHTKDDESGN